MCVPILFHKRTKHKPMCITVKWKAHALMKINFAATIISAQNLHMCFTTCSLCHVIYTMSLPETM